MTTFLTPAEKEELEERAAIMEHHGGIEREEAERLALELVLSKKRSYEPAGGAR